MNKPKAFQIALIRYNLREVFGDHILQGLEVVLGSNFIEDLFNKGEELFKDRVFLHGAPLLEKEHKLSSLFLTKDQDEEVGNHARSIVLFVAYAANLLCREEGCDLNLEPFKERIWSEIQGLKGQIGQVKSHYELRGVFDDLKEGRLSLCFSPGVFVFEGEDLVEITSYDVKESLNIQYITQPIDLEGLCDYLLAGAMFAEEKVWDTNDKADLLPEILDPSKPLPEGIRIKDSAHFLSAIAYWLEEVSGLMDDAEKYMECGQFNTMEYYQISYYSWLVDQGDPIDPSDDFDIREHFYHFPDGCPDDIAENITMNQKGFEEYLGEHCTLKYVPKP